MKLKIPPVIVTFFFGFCMFLLAKFLAVGYFDFFGRTFLIVLFLVLAALIGFIAIGQFLKAKTTVNPLDVSQTKHLVTNGIFKYSRNPMYLALLLVLLAWGFWLGNAFNSLLAAGFVSYMNKFQILPEEQALTQRFEKEYQNYLIQVRRWF